MKSLFIAIAMYSKLPAPRVDWDKKSLSWALCFFPVVGAVIGLFLAGWLALADWLELGKFLTAAGALVLPAALSGGIHLDGFCDTCDALGSHQPREKKLEILKDTHAGAFAILCCVLYLIFFFAVWCEVDVEDEVLWVLALPVPLGPRGGVVEKRPRHGAPRHLYPAHGCEKGQVDPIGSLGCRAHGSGPP